MKCMHTWLPAAGSAPYKYASIHIRIKFLDRENKKKKIKTVRIHHDEYFNSKLKKYVKLS